AVEAVAPEKAVPCAERLAALMPGAGHVVHMPAHIYIRVGRYADAIAANEHAVHADEIFIEGQKPHGLYPLAYYPHNHHFLAFAATLAGKSALAIELSARGRFTEARAALDTLQQIAASGTRAYASAGWTTPSTNLQIATHALLGEIAARQGALEEGIAHFREAMKIEDDQLYT